MIYHIKARDWEVIFGYLKAEKGLHTDCKKDLRRYVEAVWYVTRSGCQWRLLPKIYGNWRSIHRRFKRWSEKGIWERLMTHVMDKDIEHSMLDSTVIRAHACAAGYGKNSQDKEGLGRSKGGFTSKIHALVDGLGNPIKFFLTAGQRHDITQADFLINELTGSIVIADKAYDSQAFIDKLRAQDCTPVIPSRTHRKIPRDYDKHIYKERHLIECFFGKIKHYRRIFSRFDKSAVVFLGFLYFVNAVCRFF